MRSVNSPPVAGRNGAFAFDGANDIVDLGNVAALNGVNRYTIEGLGAPHCLQQLHNNRGQAAGDGDRAAMIQLFMAPRARCGCRQRRLRL